MFFTLTDKLASLEAEVSILKTQAFAAGTLNNLRSQWKLFVAFCLYFNCEYLPAEERTILCYVAFLARSFKAPNSVLNYLNAVRNIHLCTGNIYAVQKSFELSLVLKGLKRTKSHRVHKVLPIDPPLLLEFVKFLDFESANDVAIWAAFLLGFFLMARKSNLVPPSAAKFDASKHLCRGDLIVGRTGLIVNLKWSKTNQFRDRCLSIPLVAVPGSILCPVTAILNMCRLVPATSDQPAFLISKHKRISTLTYFTFTSKLKSLIALTGRDPDLFSGHSFRRGGASWAFEAGVAGELIQMHGDWTSDAYLEYLTYSTETKCSVSSSMAKLAQSL